jgi:hypothetical protein
MVFNNFDKQHYTCMKKVYLLLCLITNALMGLGQTDSLERIRIVNETNLIVEKINNNTRNVKAIALFDSTRGWKGAKTFVWIWEGEIVKIKDVVSLQHGRKNFTEYYYSYKPVLIKKGDRFSAGLKEVDENYTLPDSLFDKYYYQYDDLISGTNLLIADFDTFYFGPSYLKDAYQIYRKHYHLQPVNPFKDLKYDKVVTYDFEGRGGGKIVRGDKLDRSAKNPKELTPQQTQKFTAVLTDTATYGGSTAACFDPHMGVVFYNKDSIVAHISICFECNSLASSVYLPAEYYNQLTWEDKKYYQTKILHGFSPAGREHLRELCNSLGLTLCQPFDRDNVFDNPNRADEE